MRIMGIDAGLASTGIAILDTDINDFVLIEKIKTTIKKATPTTGHRARFIAGTISQWIMEYEIEAVVIEDIYINPKQPSAIIPVARLRGAIEQVVLDWEFEGLNVIKSSVMKKIVGGKGNVKKDECFHAIKQIYSHSALLQEKLGPVFIDTGANKIDDISDACCIAHSYRVAPTAAEFL
ncbi:Holliday junction resolvase [compost metagenome]